LFIVIRNFSIVADGKEEMRGIGHCHFRWPYDTYILSTRALSTLHHLVYGECITCNLAFIHMILTTLVYTCLTALFFSSFSRPRPILAQKYPAYAN
jgi:hypothetical protein